MDRDKRSLAALALAVVGVLSARAQNTVGLLGYDMDAMADGYMLIYPARQGTVFMLNGCGQVVHTWRDDASVPGNGFRLMDNGALMTLYVDTAGGSEVFTAGGAGESVQIKDWENNVLWDHTISSDSECLHHDAEVLPNGNILVIAWELKTAQEAWDAGRDTLGYGYSTLWPEQIIELQPVGTDSAIRVWEWHAWDHLVQDFNPTAANYGTVGDHAELIDINYTYAPNVNPDWLHINSVDYNPDMDQILLSVPFFDEIWVIDHSTTTAEAATHEGGISGRGGDLLYRWGNPITYDAGTVNDQDLFFNHGAVWVGPGLPVDDPDVGKIMVFNNRVQPSVSSADILIPPVDENGIYAYVPGNAFGPLEHEQRFATDPPTDLFSPGQGSAQKLPTGDVLVCSGSQGWVRQIRPDSSVVWSYLLPMLSGVPVEQGTMLPGATAIFQAHWVMPDDPRIQGRELIPNGYIEMEPNESFCDLATTTHEVVDHPSGGLLLEANVVADVLYVQAESNTEYVIFDPMGRLVASGVFNRGRNQLPLGRLTTGMYLLRSTSVGEAGQRFEVVGR